MSRKLTKKANRIAILGLMCSGKTHAALFLKNRGGHDNFNHILFATPLKKIGEEILNLDNGLALAYEYLMDLGVGDSLNRIHMEERGWNDNLLDNEKYLAQLAEIRLILKETQALPYTPPKSRVRLQHLGTDLRLRVLPTVWIDILLNSLREDQSYVLDDCRFMNEHKALKENGFTIIKLMVSPEMQKKRLEALYGEFDPKILTHASELDFDKMDADEGLEIDADRPLREMLIDIKEKLDIYDKNSD